MAAAYRHRDAPSRRQRLLRLALVLAVILLLNLVGSWLGQLVNFQIFPRHDALLNAALLAAVAVYILLMATPFMPGIEVGLAVMLLLGGKSALLIYPCTLAALSLSYLAGRLFPLARVRNLLDWLCLHRAAGLIRQLEPLAPDERLQCLQRQAPKTIAPWLLRHRYLLVAVLLNLPGNALLGGGGGIGLVAGMSRLIPFHRYLLVLAVAVAPVPLWLFLSGG